jgi:osmotically-inducible protein OsmY
VHIVVCDGIVTLSGSMEQKSTVPLAGRPTRRVDGVVDVINHLTYLVDDHRTVRR